MNALGSLAIPYAIRIPLVLSMRGTLGEGNPSQVPMGRATAALLEALGIQVFQLVDPEPRGPRWPGVLELGVRRGHAERADAARARAWRRT